MTASAYINEAARRAAAKRPFNLTMLGVAAAWQAEEAAIMAARPADATGCCDLCGDVYASKVLAALDSDHTYERASAAEDGPAHRDALLCKHCRRDLEARYGTEDTPDVYHILDAGMYGYSD